LLVNTDVQELQVALIVAQAITNREVAHGPLPQPERSNLHLGNTYRKLGKRYCAELVRRIEVLSKGCHRRLNAD
jgi:hypothetical protein